MEFEWDEAKSDDTKARRGFGFDEVTPVFLDPDRVIFPDDRVPYGEERWITFGLVEGRLFAVAYTRRGAAIRIISARKANSRERKRYDAQTDLQA
ncbi:BrnT family toxin [Roseicyclus persicicus]|uniref:BrnT family toxin n=1 Tax=Roseicyclus persicicus TaxID=2650661 RepID=A0A7X6GYZ9_9RHOB|nr:BrnT family toxin [Roseibacterium persicicum]NKX44971.1 BrnT family toxin [Roseibacterium persicicum]